MNANCPCCQQIGSELTAAALAGRPARDVILGAALRLVAPFLVMKPSHEAMELAGTSDIDQADPIWRDQASNISNNVFKAVFRLVRCNCPPYKARFR